MHRMILVIYNSIFFFYRMNEQRKKSQGKNIACWQAKFVKYIYSARKKK